MTELVLSDDRREAILRYLRLDPRDVNTQAMLLICERYGLDPLMKHVVLISGRPYVTRDGYLHIAHASGQFDGLEVVAEGATDEEWWAKVAVHRRDMSHPFVYRGRYPKDGQQKKYGPEMAVKTAEVMALRRAFDVTGIGAADEQWDEVPHTDPTPADTPAAGIPCRRCDYVAADTDDLRSHYVDAHGYVRLPDNSVAPPEKAASVPVSAQGEGGGQGERDHLTPAPLAANEKAQRIQTRIDVLPDELRMACEDACTIGTDGRWPNEPNDDDIAELSKVVGEFEAEAAGKPPTTGPAAARAALMRR